MCTVCTSSTAAQTMTYKKMTVGVHVVALLLPKVGLGLVCLSCASLLAPVSPLNISQRSHVEEVIKYST